MLPYEQYLKRFPAYLQQLVMESNGKRVTVDGAPVDYHDRAGVYGASPAPTGSIRSTSCCTRARDLVACDFIGFCRPLNPLGDQHDR